MKTETFTDRIADDSKVPLSGSFVIWLKNMAVKNDLHEDNLWGMWADYSDHCHRVDQSPVISEFCLWNNLIEVN